MTKLSETDFNVATKMLTAAIGQILGPIVQKQSQEVLRRFVVSNPPPTPTQKAELHFKIDMEMSAIYQILDKIAELKDGKSQKRGRINLTKR